MVWVHYCGRCNVIYDDNEIGDVTYCSHCFKLINVVEQKLEKTIGKKEVERYRKSCLKRGLYGKKIPKVFAKMEKKYSKTLLWVSLDMYIKIIIIILNNKKTPFGIF